MQLTKNNELGKIIFISYWNHCWSDQKVFNIEMSLTSIFQVIRYAIFEFTIFQKPKTPKNNLLQFKINNTCIPSTFSW